MQSRRVFVTAEENRRIDQLQRECRLVEVYAVRESGEWSIRGVINGETVLRVGPYATLTYTMKMFRNPYQFAMASGLLKKGA